MTFRTFFASSLLVALLSLGIQTSTIAQASGGFSYTSTLTASDGAAGDNFGYNPSISADGTRMAIGAIGVNSYEGAVYVYRNENNTWVFEQKIVASDGAAFGFFGLPVVMSADGTTLIVGSPGASSSMGAVYEYTRTGTTWGGETILTASNGAGGDGFGASLALSEDNTRLVVGATSALSYEGKAYAYTRSGGAWTDEQEILGVDTNSGDNFGGALMSDDGTKLILSAPAHFVGANVGQGAMYYYTYATSTWEYDSTIVASDGEENSYLGGIGLSSDGTLLVAGARYFDKPGYAYTYTLSGGTWGDEKKITPSDSSVGNYFGSSADILGDKTKIAISSTFGSTGSGEAYVYTLSGGTWSDEQIITSPNPESNDFFGVYLKFLDDGMTLMTPAGNQTVGSNAGQGAIHFNRISPTITVNVSGNGSGTITSSLGGISITYPGSTTQTSGDIPSGSSVALTAIAGAGQNSIMDSDCVGNGGALVKTGTERSVCTFSNLTTDKTIALSFQVIPVVSAGGAMPSSGGGGGSSYTPPPVIATPAPSTTPVSGPVVQPPTVTPLRSVPISKYKFLRNLKLGMIGEDIKEFQKYLNNNGFVVATNGAGSPGNETTKFGALTFQAVVKFQEFYKDEILIPAGVPSGKGTGYIGPFTRAHINGS